MVDETVLSRPGIPVRIIIEYRVKRYQDFLGIFEDYLRQLWKYRNQSPETSALTEEIRNNWYRLKEDRHVKASEGMGWYGVD